jgi:hypothetical protein
VHWCAANNPAEPLPHKRTAPVRMRRVPPKRRVLCCQRVEPAHESPHRQTRLHVNTRLHNCKAVAEAVIDTEVLLCAAARGARRRDARARAACTSRCRGRRLHGAGCGACDAAIGVARDDRGRSGGARACRCVRDSEALGASPHCRRVHPFSALLDSSRADLVYGGGGYYIHTVREGRCVRLHAWSST